MAIEEMRDARLVLGAGPCGQDAPIAIDLLAIGVDDCATKALGKCQG